MQMNILHRTVYPTVVLKERLKGNLKGVLEGGRKRPLKGTLNGKVKRPTLTLGHGCPLAQGTLEALSRVSS